MAHPLRQALLAWFVPVVAAATTFGCNHTPPPASPSPGPPAHAAVPVNPSIVGTVMVAATHKPPPLGGVVYLDNAPKQPGALMLAHVVIHHKDFIPFVTVLTVGGTATFENNDPMPHHIFSPEVPGWDTGFLYHGHPVSKTFDKAGPVTLLCNIHQEMLGYVLVIPSTSFARIDRYGKFAFPKTPPGTYQATVWVPHEQGVTKPVTVDTAPVTLNFQVHRRGAP